VDLRYYTQPDDTVDEPRARTRPWFVALAVVGLLIALAFGFQGVLSGEPPFTHLPPAGQPVVKIGTLELTTAVGFDVGLFLLVAGSLTVLIRHLTDLLPELDHDERGDR
jgi:hypothetical protein